MNIESIKKSYHKNDLDKTYETLVEVHSLTNSFRTEGDQRLLCMLSLRQRKEDEIIRLTKYLSESLAKMSIEFVRAKAYATWYHQKYATDINGYFGLVIEMFKKLKSHLSPFKVLMKKGRYHNRPSEADCENFDIQQKTMIEGSVMGSASFQLSAFPKEEQPVEVRNLMDVYTDYYTALHDGISLCMEMLDLEEKRHKDENTTYYMLETERNETWDILRNDHVLYNPNTIEQLKAVNPAYQDRMKYASEKDFAPHGYHQYNKTVMRHYYQIIYFEAMNSEYEPLERTIWGEDHDTIKKVRLVVKEFDSLLPDSFEKRDLGLYLFYFCKWAGDSNIKKVHEYFTLHYCGRYKNKLPKYPAVHHHSKNFNENNIKYKDFINSTNLLISPSSKKDWRKEFNAILASS